MLNEMPTRLVILVLFLIACGTRISAGTSILLCQTTAIRFFNSGPGKTAIDKMFELGGFVERLTVTKMCFPAGTPVLTSNGPIAIETLAPGMLVWSRDPETGKTAWKPILDTFTTHPDRFHHLRYRRDSADSDDPNGTISTTGEHPFWIVQLQDFLPASELHPGHILLLANGATATVIAHTIDASSPTPLTAYNIEVADFHTYYAGEDFIHVHNLGRECDILFSIYDGFVRKRGLTSEQSWKEIARLYDGKFGIKVKKMTDRALGTALDEAIRKDVFPGRNKPLWSSGGKVPEENMYSHFQKHVLSQKDMAPFADNPVDYVRRAHQYGDKVTSTADILVYEGISPRSGLLERFVFNRTTNEFSIRVLAGPESGAMRSLYTLKNETKFLEKVITFTKK